MTDALIYAVRDAIRAAGFNYGKAECEIMDSGQPPPRCGNFFVAIHDCKPRSTADNQLYEVYDFSVTLSARSARVSVDRIGDQLIARNVPRTPLGNREGFNAKVEQLRALLHMNWGITVLTGQTPNSANDNLAAWLTGTVYGFCEPARYRGPDKISDAGPDWFGDEPGDGGPTGIKAEMRFEGAKRFQPTTQSPVGPFA